jgi:hypothetical protein
MVFTGLAKLVEQSDSRLLDLSMLKDEDKQALLDGGVYTPESKTLTVRVSGNGHNSSKVINYHETLERANEYVLENKLADAKLLYSSVFRLDLVAFLNQYSSKSDYKVSTTSIKLRTARENMEHRKKNPISTVSRSVSIPLKTRDPRLVANYSS